MVWWGGGSGTFVFVCGFDKIVGRLRVGRVGFRLCVRVWDFFWERFFIWQ